MFTVQAHNCDEVYEIESFTFIGQAFNFIQDKSKTFYDKGNWVLKVWCAYTGKLVEMGEANE